MASAAGLGRGLATTSPMGAEMTVIAAAIAAAATMAAIVFNMTAPCSGFAPERFALDTFKLGRASSVAVTGVTEKRIFGASQEPLIGPPMGRGSRGKGSGRKDAALRGQWGRG